MRISLDQQALKNVLDL